MENFGSVLTSECATHTKYKKISFDRNFKWKINADSVCSNEYCIHPAPQRQSSNLVHKNPHCQNLIFSPGNPPGAHRKATPTIGLTIKTDPSRSNPSPRGDGPTGEYFFPSRGAHFLSVQKGDFSDSISPVSFQ